MEMTIRPRLGVMLFALIVITSADLAQAAAPPVNCRGARTSVDRAICTSPETVALDQEITALYNRGMAKLAGEERHRLALSQVAYLHRRGGCNWASHHSAHPGPAVSECVSGAMGERLRFLRSVVDRGGL
jgi:uncharacterized protein YecT (DUF1311 family)